MTGEFVSKFILLQMSEFNVDQIGFTFFDFDLL